MRTSRRSRSNVPGTTRAYVAESAFIPGMAKPGPRPGGAQPGVRHPVLVRSYCSKTPLPSALVTDLATITDTKTGQVFVCDGATFPVPAYDCSNNRPRLPDPAECVTAVTVPSYRLCRGIAIGSAEPNTQNSRYVRDPKRTRIGLLHPNDEPGSRNAHNPGRSSDCFGQASGRPEAPS